MAVFESDLEDIRKQLSLNQKFNPKQYFSPYFEKDGTSIKLNEFKQIYYDLGLFVKDTYLKQIFSRFDIDHDAHISMSEFLSILRPTDQQYGELFNAHLSCFAEPSRDSKIRE